LLADRLRACAARVPCAGTGTVAIAALLPAMVGAALALTLSPSRPAVPMPPAAQARVEDSRTAAPVRMIGAGPRSADCAEQVWPYIAQRCLTRAASDHGPSAGAPASEQPAGQAARIDATARAPSPAGAEEVTKRRRAVAYLPLPQPRLRATAAADASILPEATTRTWGRRHRALLGADAEEAARDEALDPAFFGEPPPRLARRAHRHRRHGWSRRSVFGFPF
jgi:hypothetical protein